MDALSNFLNAKNGLAEPNQEARILPGTYTVVRELKVKPISLVIKCSEYPYPQSCILSGGDQWRIMSITGTGDVETVLRGLLFTRGRNDNSEGSAFAIYGALSNVRIMYCAFTNNKGLKGAVYVSDGTVLFSGCKFRDNVATQANGGKDLHYENGATTLTECGYGFFEEPDENGQTRYSLGTSKDLHGKGKITGTISSYSKCTPCPKGAYSTANAVPFTCTRCHPGSFAPEGGLSTCFDCPQGKRDNAANRTTCADCAPGTANKGRGGSSPSSCQACWHGTYNPFWGASECILCPLNSHIIGTGSESATSCIECEPHLVSSLPRNACQRTVVCDTAPDLVPSNGTCSSCSKPVAWLTLIAAFASFLALGVVLKRNCGNKWMLGYSKIVINFIQFSTIVTYVDVNWSEYVQIYSALLSYPAAALRCIVNDPGWSTLTNVLFVVYVTIFVSSALLSRVNSWGRDSIGRLEVEVFTCANYFVSVVPVCWICFNAVECFNDMTLVTLTGDPEMDKDAGTQYNLDEAGGLCSVQTAVHAIVAPVLYAIFIPLFVHRVFFYDSTSNLSPLRTNSPIYFFVCTYKPTWALWDGYEHARKVALLLAISMFRYRPDTQATLLISINAIGLCSSLYNLPMEVKKCSLLNVNAGLLFLADFISQIVVFVGCLVAMIMAVEPAAAKDLSLVVFALFSCFFLFLVLWLSHESKTSLNEIQPIPAFVSGAFEMEATIVSLPDEIPQTPVVASASIVPQECVDAFAHAIQADPDQIELVSVGDRQQPTANL
jgi:hypothetical protein